MNVSKGCDFTPEENVELKIRSETELPQNGDLEMEISKECDFTSEENVGLKSELEKKTEHLQNNFITIHIFTICNVTICKPLATLNIGYLFWMAASASGMVHFHVFLKTRGLTIHDIFLINTISSIVMVLAVAALAVIIDKIGRSKIVLILNLVVAGLLMFSMTLIPSIPTCNAEDQVFRSFNRSIRLFKGNSSCFERSARIQTDLCKTTCLDSIDNLCDSKTVCESIYKIEGDDFASFLFNGSFCFCLDNVTTLLSSNKSEFFCKSSWNSSCAVVCLMANDEDCLYEKNVLVKIYIFISCLALISYSSVFRFFDITSMNLIKEYNSNYGVVRFWGVIGQMLGFVMSGFVVQLANPFDNPSNYEASFYLYFVICLLTALITYRIDVRNLNPATNLCQKTLTLVRNSETLIFSFIILVLGTSWGFNISYKNWYLADIGATSQVFSAVGTLSTLYGLPFLFKSEWYLRKIGDRNMFFLALLAHAVHSLSYSWLGNTWLAILFETTSVFSYHLLWVAAMHFCHRITPAGLFATVNSTTGSLHYSVGRITGSFMGGFLMKYYGGRFTYQMFGILNISVAVPYIVYIYCRKKRV